jgi:hypothetical protein
MFRYIPEPEKHEFAFEAGVHEKTFRFGYLTPNQPQPDEEAKFFPLPNQL